MMYEALKSRLVFLVFILILLLSATNTYLILHFRGIINSNYAAVIGKTGPMGSPGVPGVQGDQGSQGSPGTPGLTGPTGATGPQGSKGDTSVVTVQGPVGNTGSAGPQGSPGPQGEPAPPAKEVEFRCHNNTLQFRYTGDFLWENLIQLSVTESCL